MMIKKYTFYVVISILLLSLSACTFFKDVVQLDELKNLGEIDRIEIKVNKQDEQGVWIEDFTKTIDDSQQIGLITAAFQNLSEGWQGGYVPYLPGRLTVEFYRGEELIVPIIVVSYTNTRGGMSYFLSRPAGPARPIEESEFKELIGLLGIDEDFAYYGDLTISVK